MRTYYPTGIPIDVCILFERKTLDAWNAGFDRYSARTIIEIIRWHHHVERGNREFKVNDHWSPRLSRWVMNRHAKLAGFFELRELKGRNRWWDEEEDDDELQA
jgi:hypothetical protein